MLLTSANVNAQLLHVAEVDSVMKANPKPLMILLSADWCKYCQVQKKQLKTKLEVDEGAGTNVYFAVLNAEADESVLFNGHIYRFKPNGYATGVHELAMALTRNAPASYPTWVLLDENYQILYRHSGVLSPRQLKDLTTAVR